MEEQLSCVPFVTLSLCALLVSTLKAKRTLKLSILNAHHALWDGTPMEYMCVNPCKGHWTMLTFSSSHISFVLFPLPGKSGRKFSPPHWWSFRSVWRGWLTYPHALLTTISMTGCGETLFTLIWTSILMMFHGMTLALDLVICSIDWKLVTWKGMLISIPSFCSWFFIYLDVLNLWSL